MKLQWSVICFGLAMSGCGGGCGPTSFCTENPEACEDHIDQWYYDDSCELTGDLDVVLGHGEDGFNALEAGVEPTIHYGNQGGQHVFFAYRVENPATDVYDILKVRFLVERERECYEWEGTGTGADVGSEDISAEDVLVDLDGDTEDAGGQTEDAGGQTEDAGGQTEDAGGQTEDAGGEPDAGPVDAGSSGTSGRRCVDTLADRTTVAGITHPLRIVDGGSVEEYGVIVVLRD